MTGGVVATALEGEEFVNRGDSDRVCAPHTHFPATGTLDHLVRNRRMALLHDRRPRDDLRVDLEGFGEVARAERDRDIAHVLADSGDAARIPPPGAVAIEDDASAVGKILKDVGGGVLIYAHHHLPAFLHGGEVRVRRVLRRAARR